MQEGLQAQESNQKELAQAKKSFETLNNELESSRKRLQDLDQSLVFLQVMLKNMKSYISRAVHMLNQRPNEH